MALNEENTQPNAYRVEDDDAIEEKDLRRTYLFGKGDDELSGDEPNLEGKGYGGQSFGENVGTPAGDDKNNPSQNAGYSNEYFRRTEPLEEHPEHNNFKDPNQLGQPNYAQAADGANAGQSDSEDNAPQREQDAQPSEDSQQDANVSYEEGTADNDGNRSAPSEDDNNIPGYNELPDQQKVGE
ncbi:hypothetical protein DYU05_04460 [Mucilaginibacter terrenus]|uniref:Uncharacterized protein n=1 Tax=Mucilaginibacter terrenus TaxID=2482727 RepID=A0A3E2NV23_9SPHI|nr:hypothetical protein [Mucilaginibacter terrenus]RFZ84864.1 hypothetical protein DYU05_04460 [Mucilaginibacter terrenus]